MSKQVKCLIIDDDIDDQEFFALAVGNLGKEVEITITTAVHGREGLQKLNANDLPHCIFLDLNMPIMNGKAFLQSVKTHPSYKSIPIYILSTSTSELERNECLSLGAKNFLVKPTRIADLVKMLRNTVLAEL